MSHIMRICFKSLSQNKKKKLDEKSDHPDDLKVGQLCGYITKTTGGRFYVLLCEFMLLDVELNNLKISPSRGEK